MFVFLSILAASIDGFVSGFVIAATGIKFGFAEFVKSTAVILICCIIASFTGYYLAPAYTEQYINTAGVLVMLYLAWSAFFPDKDADSSVSVYTVAFSVAADAAIVCIYLAADGFNVYLISIMSAVMHSVLMYTGVRTANRIIKEKRIKYTGYISGVIFLSMALYKLSQI